MIKAVPWRTPFTNSDGTLDRVWIIFFQSLGTAASSGGGGTPGVSGGTNTLAIIAGTATPDPSLGSTQKIIVDQAVTMAAPLGTPLDGDRLRFYIIQHLTAGGFQIVWDPIYILGDYATQNIDLGTFGFLDIEWDTANWYISGFPVSGQT